MRDKKFKGKCIITEAWAHGHYYYCIHDSAHKILCTHYVHPTSKIEEQEVQVLEIIHPETLGQYIGEIEGIEFYEGDLFEFDYLKGLHDVVRLKGSFSFDEDDLRYEIDIIDHNVYVCLSYNGNGVFRNFKKVGNIHDKHDQ